MHVLYDDSGSFKTATVLAESEASLQVETTSGRRSKIKKSNVILKFSKPGPSELLTQAEAAAEDLDIEFLWECAPQEDFEVTELAAEYHGREPTPVEICAMLLRLHGAPVYFHRRGKGRYRPAPPDILEAALAALEKKKRQAEQQEAWAEAMLAGELPEPIARQANTLAFRPDKNSMEWKALEMAANRAQVAPVRLLLQLGAWPHTLALLRERFLHEHFPRGLEIPAIDLPPFPDDLPLAEVEAYSFDDTTTTEIDDALSAVQLDSEHVRVGVHIAAPALIVTRDSPLDEIARSRMSTVYMPGDKIPMQPDNLIEAFSLEAGRPTPAISLYATINTVTGDLTAVETRLENVQVTANLRLPDLEAMVTETALDDEDQELPYGHVLRPLWRGAKALLRVRETIRGKPELYNRVEFNFYIEGDPWDPNHAIVRIVERQRGAPLDRLVSEYMILANSEWGRLLAEHGVPGLYRSQQANRVRMTTHALPHDTIGVAQYAWCTSPLRRYVDLVNQQQLIAVARHGVSARLAAPYKPKDADLYAIISAFEAKYSAYSTFQDVMERYWCLRWLKQENITRCDAVVVRDDVVRLVHAPFYTRVGGMPELPRGHVVMLDILDMDELEQSLECRYVGDGSTEASAVPLAIDSPLIGSGPGADVTEVTDTTVTSEQSDAAEDEASSPDEKTAE